jgi:NTP pyrophosphatase (non-canonical NTP hydrolase)
MDMQTYKTKALRTASDKFYGEKVDAGRFYDDTIVDLLGINGVVDGVKKGLFYGKDSDVLDKADPANAETWEGIDRDLLHAGLGIVTEGVEFLEKVLVPGKPDRAALVSELGDVLWYANVATKPLETDLGEVADLNIAKLEKRYPEKFTLEQAVNKDVAAEDGMIGDLLAEPDVAGTIVETAWVIEHAPSSPAEPEYFQAEVGKPSWTKDVFGALRFAREADAKNFAGVFLPGVFVRVAEHIFESV